MSRSTKKNAVHSRTKRGAKAGMQKEWKVGNHKKNRRIAKEIIGLIENMTDEEFTEAEYQLFKQKEGHIWSSPSDGKVRCGEGDDYYEKAKRK